MRILYLEDAYSGRVDIVRFNRERYIIDFVDDLTTLHECLFYNEGYKIYGVIVLDLSINANQGLSPKKSASYPSKDKSSQSRGGTHFGSPLDMGFFNNPVVE